MSVVTSPDYPLFTNQQILEMSDNDLNYNINEFQSYIKRVRRNNQDAKAAEEECAYLLNERDIRNK